MKYTENYRLLKPDQEDYYNVDDFNGNAEIIDGKMKEALDVGSILEKVKSVDGDGSGLDADVVKGKDVYGWAAGTFSNPNILINGNFTNAVNQRGKSEYTVQGEYTLDRWRLISDAKASVSPEGLTLDGTSSSLGYAYISQALERNIETGAKVTLSWCDEDGVHSATGEVPPKPEEGAVFFATAYGNDGKGAKYARCSLDGKNVMCVEMVCARIGTYKWIKLEYGETATPFVPRLYAEELALCQRYYLGRIELPHLPPYVMWPYGKKESGYQMHGSAPFPVEMRVPPTISSVTIRSNSHGNVFSAESFKSHVSRRGLGVLYDIVTEDSAEIADGTPYMVSFEADAEISPETENKGV